MDDDPCGMRPMHAHAMLRAAYVGVRKLQRPSEGVYERVKEERGVYRGESYLELHDID